MAQTGSVTLQKDTRETYEHVIERLKTAGNEITLQTPPNSIGFRVSKSSWGWKYIWDGQVAISSLQDEKSNLVVTLSPVGTQVAAYIFSFLVFAFITWLSSWFMANTLGFWFIPFPIYSIILVAIYIGSTFWWWWDYAVTSPELRLTEIINSLSQETPTASKESPEVIQSMTTSRTNKYCSACGQRIAIEASFCQSCGHKQ